MKSLSILLCLFLYNTPSSPDNVLPRFKTPDGYTQVNPAPRSFGALPLKPAGTPTRTYKGDIAQTDVYTAAVVDISVGNQDLQQCADAVMRLRGEYLYQQKSYNTISFKFESGFKCDYLHYANGYRYHDNKWVLKTKKDYSYPTFMHYMTLVFMYAGTLSLEKELHPVTDPTDVKTGDVFIHGGSPGHFYCNGCGGEQRA